MLNGFQLAGWSTFFDGIENIKKEANNRCWICTHLRVLRFVFLGARTKIHFSKGEENKSDSMAVGFVATTVASVPYSPVLALFGEEFLNGLSSCQHDSFSQNAYYL